MKHPETGTIIAITLALLPAVFFANLAWHYRLRTETITRTKYVPVKTTTRVLSDGSTFDCSPHIGSKLGEMMICRSTDNNTEIDCTSNNKRPPFLIYFC